MENAVAELMQENNGGLLVWFFEILWAQTQEQKESEGKRTPSYFADFPGIPHSVVFNYSHAQGWFFEPSNLQIHHHRARGSVAVRRIRRKRRIHLVASDIFEEMCSGCSAPHEIVAQLITRQSPKCPDAKISYFTRTELEQLLFRGSIAEGSILQKFLNPQGPHAQPESNSNVSLLVQWQPSYTYIERFVNIHSLGDKSKTAAERGVTIEGGKFSEGHPLSNNATILRRCQAACNALATHVHSITGIHLRSMVCVMKISTDNRLVLQWAQRVSVVENDRLVPNLPVGLHNVEVEDEVTQSEQQRLRDMQGNGKASEKTKAYIGSLLPEDRADALFDRIAPKPWVLAGRQAYRFAAIEKRRRLMSPSLGGARCGSAASSLRRGTSSKPSHDSDSDAETSISASPLRRTPSRKFSSPTFMIPSTFQRTVAKELEREILTRNEGSITVGLDGWSEEPSRLEVALMKDGMTDMYPMKRVAHNAASLGLREKYLASMRSASASRPLVGPW